VSVNIKIIVGLTKLLAVDFLSEKETLMDTCIQLPNPVTGESNSDAMWVTLYPLLFSLVKRWVYTSNVITWIGQELDVAWDIVLVSIQRTYEFTMKAQRENIPIASLKRLSITIAKNYFQDLRRKECRLLHFDQDGYIQGKWAIVEGEVDLSVAVLEKVHEEWLFHELAKVIARFPRKMRTALLIDLASRMAFNADEDNTNPTPLQKAFSEVGIQLHEYQHLLPSDPAAKARHASLISLGYKKIALSFRTRQFAEVASTMSR